MSSHIDEGIIITPDRRVRVLVSPCNVELAPERAADVKSGFALTEENAAAVARICYRLEGGEMTVEQAIAFALGA